MGRIIDSNPRSVDLTKVKPSVRERLESLNKIISDSEMHYHVPYFATGDGDWNQESTLSVSFPMQSDDCVLEARTVDVPNMPCAYEEVHVRTKKTTQRLIFHDKGQGAATSIVIVNGKYLITVMRHRSAIQRSIEELPRGNMQQGDYVRRKYLGAYNPGQAVVHRLIPKLQILRSDENDILDEWEKVGEIYKDPALHAGTEEIYLIKVTLPDFDGDAKQLELPNSPIRLKARSLKDVVDGKFRFKDAHSIAALSEALPRLKTIVSA